MVPFHSCIGSFASLSGHPVVRHSASSLFLPLHKYVLSANSVHCSLCFLTILSSIKSFLKLKIEIYIILPGCIRVKFLMKSQFR